MSSRDPRERNPGQFPDLELAKPPPKARSAAQAETMYETDAKPVARSQGVSGEQSAFGGGHIFEDDNGGAGEISLELDIKPTQATAPKLAQQLAQQLGPSIASEDPSDVAASVGGVGITRKNAAVADPVELFEARALAAYGEAPKQWWRTPQYAYKVRARQAELRAELAARREDARRMQNQIEDALVALAQRARPIAEKAVSFKRTIEQMDSAESLLRSRDGELMSDMDAQKTKLVAIDQRISTLESALAAARSEERALAEEIAEAQAAVQRAEAKIKRLDIELRTQATQIHGSGPASKNPPPTKKGGA